MAGRSSHFSSKISACNSPPAPFPKVISNTTSLFPLGKAIPATRAPLPHFLFFHPDSCRDFGSALCLRALSLIHVDGVPVPHISLSPAHSTQNCDRPHLGRSSKRIRVKVDDSQI
jgi:hypothetical protein